MARSQDHRSRVILSVALACAVAVGCAAVRAAHADEPPRPTATAASAPRAQGASDAAATLGPSERALLEKSPFVYISSTRKDGSLSKQAEIWFTFADGSVWVASAPTAWRVKRIKWHRPMATIWIGTRDGPSFRARGEIVSDPKRYDQLCDAFAVKYPDRWPRWEKSFREGLRSGERVLIRYVPVAEGAGGAAAPAAPR
ncbi:MAG TPA: hypothetical protein VFD92_00195 [Candidatus Binatia bacterium]|nr:hypothetical protein [Candidatus Binatia bacterium]